MSSFRSFLAAMALLLAGAFACNADDKIRYNRDIRPILSDYCFACHGPDGNAREGELRLDDRNNSLAGGAIVPGKASESEMIRRILSNDADEVMPRPESRKQLTDLQKDLLKRWIAEGAEYEAHWSFVTPRKPKPPAIAATENPIDKFLQARLAKEGLKPSATASRETLIRRVALDLTGLPPTRAEVSEFLADKSPKAWENVIDRMLDKPAYGEHMARYWLDLARYADTHGLHLDNERSMWPYRDWVVRSFNQNLSFDEFTRWQLAGDLLPAATRDQRIASGFNRCNVTTSEGGSINEEWVFRYAVDRTSTAIEVWMGLTAGCSVCHDHKFDPLSMKEYYSLYSFFHSAADPAMDGNKIDTPPIMRIASAEDEKRTAELEEKLAGINQKINDVAAKLKYTDPATLVPPPEPKTIETVWFEDNFPNGSTPQASADAPLRLIDKEQGPVFSGQRALARTSKGAVSQDFFSGGVSFTVPKNGTFFVYCFLDETSPPETIMVQFHVGDWKNRAVWGEQEKIPFGKPGTTEKVHMGPLPKQGEWVRLEFSAAQVGLKPGAKIDGYAFTQFSGTVTWDRLGIAATTDLANDPAWSWKIWKKRNQGKRNNALPEGLRQLVRGKPSEKWTEDESKRVFQVWLTRFYQGARDLLKPFEAEKARLEQVKKDMAKNTPITLVMADLATQRESFVMLRGQYNKPGEKVTRGVPAFLPPLPAKPGDRDYNRLDLANWLVSREHPLTSRVAVNRIWQQFFGVGLVRSSADFGSQGELPSHPELLDWLAVQFIEDGWDVQRLVKRILSSDAYRQSSVVTPELLAKDPENRLLARGPRFRLDAEVLRDQALFVSGLLVPTIGGKGVRPYQPPNIWEPVGFGSSNTRYYKQDVGDGLYRRSLYTFLKRTAPPPFMSTFDAPNREQSCTVRGRSNTPMQALQLMNDVQYVEAARNLAERILKEGGATDDARARWAWLAVTVRPATDVEIQITLDALTTHRARYAADADAANKLVSYGESKRDDKIDAGEHAAWTLISNLLLNLDEVVGKN